MKSFPKSKLIDKNKRRLNDKDDKMVNILKKIDSRRSLYHNSKGRSLITYDVLE